MRSATAALALLMPGCAAPAPDPAEVPPALLGPVTALVETGGGVLACSQAGIALLEDGASPDGVPQARLLCDPGFRVVAVLAVDGTLWACGGIPGEAGLVARIVDGAVAVEVRLADDLVSCIAPGAADRLVCGCDDGRVLVVDRDSLAPRGELRRHTAPVRALASSGGLLASAGLDGNLMLGPVDGAGRVLRDHSAGIDCAAWSADGSLLASGARDGRLRIHDREGRLLGSSPPLRSALLSIAADPALGFVAGTADGRLLRVDPADLSAPGTEAELGTPIHALLGGAPRLLGLTGRIAARRPPGG
jgi:hypothetical protein